MKVGYARVSTVGQSLESQIEQLKEYGCEKIYMEKESGKKTDRQELDNARKALRKGDKLIVTKIDRLARSVRDLHNIAIELAAEGEGNKKRPFQIEQ
ncbi:recombinase family protein [Bacillus sp. ISL-4]|uniref:recombinase family protein n=1 Tax=Bacillus sp. ISL-4 TaxID=2819125 RepID=UPI001BE61842|nr:recombinase family protein [Bacillus sp. ISL-4]MBT2671204.1 recombinase family protein [Streptomyces sp. ISL-14]